MQLRSSLFRVGRIDGGLAPSVPLLQLTNHFLVARIGSRQQRPQYFHDVVAGKQRQFFFVFPAHLKQEEHRQHDHR